MDNKAFGAAIRAAREREGVTQRALAKMIPVTPCFMYKIEKGDALPSLPVAVSIATVLGVGLDELTGTGQGEDVAKLKAANTRLGRQLGAALDDLRMLDNCAVCGWNDKGECRAPKDLANCFAWRGAEQARLWEG